jgi:hypothetical protein
MSTTTKTYDTTYKKKVEVDRDRFFPGKLPKGSSSAAVVELSAIGVTGH